MHNRASDQLLIPWLSLGHFNCLVANMLVYTSRLSHILSCIEARSASKRRDDIAVCQTQPHNITNYYNLPLYYFFLLLLSFYYCLYNNAEQSLISTSYSLVIPWSLLLFSRRDLNRTEKQREKISQTTTSRPRRDATTLLSVKRNHKISQTTTNYHSTTSFYYCFLSTTACTTMHNRASYQLLIPWLSLGRFSCLFFISSTLPQDWLKICTTEPQINFLFLGYPLVASPVYFLCLFYA